MGVLASACGPRRIALPTDAGTPLQDVQSVHAQVSAACAGVRTLTAELGLSGRAGAERLRGRIIAGFERPASMRLEAPAPFGQPVFILAARANNATLVLRDGRALTNAMPDEILAALTGVDLGPADLQAILTGCVLPDARAVNGRVHDNGWASIDVVSKEAAGGAATATLFLRPDGSGWRLMAARRNSWQLEYPAWQGRFPQSVRLMSDAAAAPVDLTATIAQLETNGEIDPAAFTLVPPPGATMLTLDELRAAGPLRGQ